VRLCVTVKPWRKGTVPLGTCPECEAEVHVDTDADKGDAVTCEECATQLEVVGLDPVELDIVEDDLDDEDDFDDEDEEAY
jgi:alpha-aminoadipate carrier protein LysW